MSAVFTIRLLAAICAALAMICLAMAWQVHRAEGRAACWRAVAEDGVAADGDCSRLR